MKKLYDHQLDEDLNLFLLIKSAEVRIAKNGKKYLAFTFQDKSGQMDGKYWGVSEEDIEQFQAGRVVWLSGKREVFQNTAQIKITQLRLATTGEPTAVQNYMEQAPMTPAEIEAEVTDFLYLIVEATLARIVRHVYNKHRDAFYTFPAAKKNHHAMPGGLSFHTLSMLRLAKAIIDLYPQINASLLYAGIVLHDIGKTIELSGPVGTEYTVIGNLIGHIALVNEEITRACAELSLSDSNEQVVLLRHMVLAHHGKLEFGSPVVPHLLEAELLNQIDMLDAGINMIQDALQKTESGQFSERVFALNSRTFYKPHGKGHTPEEGQ